LTILRFYYDQGITSDGQNGGTLWSAVEVVGSQTVSETDYAKYLGGVFHFDINSPDHCADVLSEIEKVERGESEKAGWTGNAFFTDIYRDRVEVEHQQFVDHPDWPLWSCPLGEFKVALRGWKSFLELPVNMNSEVLVELPNG